MSGNRRHDDRGRRVATGGAKRGGLARSGNYWLRVLARTGSRVVAGRSKGAARRVWPRFAERVARELAGGAEQALGSTVYELCRAAPV